MTDPYSYELHDDNLPDGQNISNLGYLAEEEILDLPEFKDLHSMIEHGDTGIYRGDDFGDVY